MEQNNFAVLSGRSFFTIYNQNDPSDPKSWFVPDFPRFSVGNSFFDRAMSSILQETAYWSPIQKEGTGINCFWYCQVTYRLIISNRSGTRLGHVAFVPRDGAPGVGWHSHFPANGQEMVPPAPAPLAIISTYSKIMVCVCVCEGLKIFDWNSWGFIFILFSTLLGSHDAFLWGRRLTGVTGDREAGTWASFLLPQPAL